MVLHLIHLELLLIPINFRLRIICGSGHILVVLSALWVDLVSLVGITLTGIARVSLSGILYASGGRTHRLFGVDFPLVSGVLLASWHLLQVRSLLLKVVLLLLSCSAGLRIYQIPKILLIYRRHRRRWKLVVLVRNVWRERREVAHMVRIRGHFGIDSIAAVETVLAGVLWFKVVALEFWIRFWPNTTYEIWTWALELCQGIYADGTWCALLYRLKVRLKVVRDDLLCERRYLVFGLSLHIVELVLWLIIVVVAEGWLRTGSTCLKLVFGLVYPETLEILVECVDWLGIWVLASMADSTVA